MGLLAPYKYYNLKTMEDLFLKKIGKTIRDLRNRNQITQEMLASIANICPKYLGEIERGDANLSVTILCKIADALKIEPSELLIYMNANIVSEKEHYLKKIRSLIKDKDEATVKRVLQAMELLLQEK